MLNFNNQNTLNFAVIILALIVGMTAVSCKSSEQASKGTPGKVVTVVDSKRAAQQDSLLTAHYSKKLGAPFKVVKKALVLYKFIDKKLGIPCSDKPGKYTTNDVILVQTLYRKAYQRKVPGTYKELLHTNLLSKFSSQKYLAQGDILFFKEPIDSVGNAIELMNQEPPERVIGVYLLNDKFITCAKQDGAVAINNLNTDYWQKRFWGAGRLK